VVVTGLPASGKTTVGGLLQHRLGLPLIDKDTILESLFDSLGSPDQAARTRLSRASDEVLFSLAAQSADPVLVNWWNHDSAPSRLRSISPLTVEVFCDCPVEVAAARFEARKRHPGHHDPQRTPDEVVEQVRRAREAFRGPLRLGGPLIHIDTSDVLDSDTVAAQVRKAMSELSCQR
jgi:shikimate kinase